MMEHSFFDVSAINRMLMSCGLIDAPLLGGYDQFCQLFPLSSRSDLYLVSEEVRLRGGFLSCYLVGSSGTTGAPVFFGREFSAEGVRDSYALEIRRFLGRKVFSQRDVVANLLAPGCFGYLYEGISRLLEPIGCVVLPIGRLDLHHSVQECITVCRDVGVNTLIATPAGIVQAARLVKEYAVSLDIKKIVYIGEQFSAVKQSYVRSIWPNAQFYGLYGNTEIGLIGVSTPQDPEGHYDFLSKWVFAEVDDNGVLYLTDLRGAVVPVIRYNTGDRARLLVHEGSVCKLVLYGRSDSCFNFCGNLISTDRICKALWNTCGGKFSLQLTLTSCSKGMDHLHVDGDFEIFSDPKEARIKAERALSEIAELEEGVRRGIASLRVACKKGLWLSPREKVPTLRDLR